MSLKSLVTFSLSLASFSGFRGLFLRSSKLRSMGLGGVDSILPAGFCGLSTSELSIVDEDIESLSLALGHILFLISLGSLFSEGNSVSAVGDLVLSLICTRVLSLSYLDMLRSDKLALESSTKPVKSGTRGKDGHLVSMLKVSSLSLCFFCEKSI